MSSHALPFTEESLSIVGYQNQIVANTFFRQRKTTDRLAIVLPGAGYSARMPLLYYAVSMFLEHGADVLTVDYEYRSNAARTAADFQQKLTENALAAIRQALRQRPYQHITLIGKSIGTRAMSWILSSNDHPFRDIRDFRTVWLTPIWTDDLVFPLMLNWKGQALHVIGTADFQCYDSERHRQIEYSANAHVVTIPNADHSLDVEGDIKASLAAISSAIDAVKTFVFAE